VPGPFINYVRPDVYTRTLTEAPVASLLGELRIPVFIGVGRETLLRLDYDLIRGSSANVDNLMTNEDVSSQLDGTNAMFVVRHYPIVRGDGTGTTTNNPRDMTVTVNGNPVPIAQVRGSIGEVHLDHIPYGDDVVKITYWFNRTDTLISDEDVSAQILAGNRTFKVANVPIVDGSNGGVPTTTPAHVSVWINGSPVGVSLVDGQEGTFTLVNEPDPGDTILVTYYTNTWRDTWDYLPDTGIVQVLRVGWAPERNDFVDGTDFIVKDNEIHWGASYRITPGDHTQGATYFDDTQIQCTLWDNRYHREYVGLGTDSVAEYSLTYIPTDGSGGDRVTDDPAKFLVEVFGGATPHFEEVDVIKADGLERKIWVQAPSGYPVYVTYWYNLLGDEEYILTVKNADIADVGQYTVTTPGGTTVYPVVNSPLDNKVPDALTASTPGAFGLAGHYVADPNFDAESEMLPWPGTLALGPGAPDWQTIPGAGVLENLEIRFTSATDFDVFSDSRPATPGQVGSGTLGQTFIDGSSGFRFTMMDPADVGLSYSFQAGDILRFVIGNEPTLGSTAHWFLAGTTYGGPEKYRSPRLWLNIPGLRVDVFDTEGIREMDSPPGLYPGDSGIIETYDKSGNEPDVGDIYYISYEYEKTDFTTKIYTRFKDVQTDYGELSPTNRVVLAAYLAFINGSAGIAIKQVLREVNPDGTTGTEAPSSAYIAALEELKNPIRGDIMPAVMVPLTTDETVLETNKFHCEIMSSIQYQGERIGFYGFPTNTLPYRAQEVAKRTFSENIICVYPDGGVIGLLDEYGDQVEYVVDGTMMASAVVGRDVSPQFDVATPLTRKQVIGFERLFRRLDRVEMNQLASAGITILEDLDPNMRIRHYLTTDMTTALTREPSIIKIKHYVQQQARFALRPFIGRKFLPRVLGHIVTALNATLSALVTQEIIVAYSGTTATPDPNEPTTALVEAYYSPVFPLNWIVVTFHLRTTL